MKIVSDAGCDISAQQLMGEEISILPLSINLDGKTYRSGVDVTYKEFYTLLAATDGLPTTSLPSPGDFAEVYRELATQDPEIISVHISSGLSGTSSAARDGAALVPEANVTIHDTMTLSIGEGWQVEAAVRAARAGWDAAQTVPVLEQVRDLTETVFTLPDLKYLIHGGRISHIKGLLAQILNIKPIIGVSKVDGKYEQRAQLRTFQKAMAGIVNLIAKDVPRGAPLRIQVAHANYPEGADQLQDMIEKVFPCEKLPISDIAPVLGAHTGPGLVGLSYAALDKYPQIPSA
jgi:DegV family protein with EDD domain